ncbi:MAG: aldehyde ferredoxin oxidoreductase family protein [Bacillota bacterium]
MGRFWLIDLSERKVEDFYPQESVLREYIGGAGLGARFLYDHTGPNTDPLGPENILVFAVGPLTGTKAITSGRHAVVAKSPLTGIWGESDSGGSWGAALKRTGCDGLLISGRSDRPCYIWVSEDSLEIRDASHLWGYDTYEVDSLLKAETDSKAVVACIGPAGEKLARIATIMNDGRHSRAAGRCGLGAVMGSKNLKAIVARGSRNVPVAHPDALDRSVKELAPFILGKLKHYRDFGTAGGVISAAAIGDLPTKNWTLGDWLGPAEKISGQTMANTILTGRYRCTSCIVGCGRTVSITQGRFMGVNGAGPEYESIAGFGSMCLVDELEAIAMANELCNRYGIDTISAGHAVAFAIEAFERGFITTRDTAGIKLRWGDPEIMIELVHKIGRREGIGHLLGEGVKRAAEEIGGLTQEFAMEVKGLEPAFHDPRAMSSLAVAYATNPRGACHRGGSHIMERSAIPELGYDQPFDRFAASGKGPLTARLQDYMGLFNSLKLCQFIAPAIQVSDSLNWLNQVTGWDMDLAEFLKVGERQFNLKRMYNVRCGISRKDDRLPSRLATQKLKDGGAANQLPQLNEMLNDYYEYRGWTVDGIPTAEKLRSLGLDREAWAL